MDNVLRSKWDYIRCGKDELRLPEIYQFLRDELKLSKLEAATKFALSQENLSADRIKVNYDQLLEVFKSTPAAMMHDERVLAHGNIMPLAPPRMPASFGNTKSPDFTLNGFEGYVNKRAHNFVKNWSKRWLVIEPHYALQGANQSEPSIITFFQTVKKKKFKRQVKLENIDHVGVIENTPENAKRFKPNVFEIVLTDGFVYDIAASSSQELQQWISEITTHCLAESVIDGREIGRLKSLINMGASHKAVVSVDDNHNYPILLLVISNYTKFDEIITYFLGQGCSPRPLCRWSFLSDAATTITAGKIASLLRESELSLDLIGDDGHEWSLLHFMVHFEEIDSIKLYSYDFSSELYNHQNTRGDTPLFMAAKINTPLSRDAALVFADKCNIDTLDHNRDTILHVAIRAGNSELSLKLIAIGCDVNAVDVEGNSCLHLAIKSSMFSVARCIAKQEDVELNMRDKVNNDTAFVLSIKFRCEDLACFLLSLNANININSSRWNMDGCEGDSPLHVAMKLKLVRLACMMVLKHADLAVLNTQGNNAMHLAIKEGLYGVASLMLENESVKGVINRVDTDGEHSCLMLAVLAGHLSLAELMIQNGADVNIMNSMGENPIHALVYAFHKTNRGFVEDAKSTSQFGADLEKAIDFSDSHQSDHTNEVNLILPMKEMAHAYITNPDKYTDFLRLLLKSGCASLVKTSANVSIIDDYQSTTFSATIPTLKIPVGSTAMHLCNTLGFHNKAMLEVLLDHDINIVAATDHKGNSPLHVAILSGNAEMAGLCVSALKRNHCNEVKSLSVNYINKNNKSPLHLALEKHFVDVALSLLEAGAYSHLWNGEGWSAIHTAANENLFEIFSWFRQYGFNLDCRTEDGWTPLMIAVARGHHHSVQALLSLNTDVKLLLPVNQVTKTGQGRRNLLHIVSQYSNYPDGPCPTEYLQTAKLVAAIASDIIMPLIPGASGYPAEKDIIKYLNTVTEGVKSEPILEMKLPSSKAGVHQTIHLPPSPIHAPPVPPSIMEVERNVIPKSPPKDLKPPSDTAPAPPSIDIVDTAPAPHSIDIVDTAPAPPSIDIVDTAPAPPSIDIVDTAPAPPSIDTAPAPPSIDIVDVAPSEVERDVKEDDDKIIGDIITEVSEVSSCVTSPKVSIVSTEDSYIFNNTGPVSVQVSYNPAENRTSMASNGDARAGNVMRMNDSESEEEDNEKYNGVKIVELMRKSVKVESFGVSRHEQAQYQSNFDSAKTKKDLLSFNALLASLKTSEKAAVDRAILQSADATMEWLKSKRGKTILKRKMKQVLRDSDGKVSDGLALEKAQEEILNTAVEESKSEIKSLFNARRQDIQQVISEFSS